MARVTRRQLIAIATAGALYAGFRFGHTRAARPENRDSTSSLKLSASPDGKNGAQTCSAIPMDASLAALGLGLLALARRRRS